MAGLPTLNQDLLDDLERGWRDQNAPILQKLRPGLTDDAMDAATEEVGVSLSAEARVWWRWHDGVSDYLTTYAIGGTHLLYYSLAKAIEQYRFQRELAAEVTTDWEGVTAHDWWHPGWLPWIQNAGGGVFACDCSLPLGAPSPIRHIDHKRRTDFQTPVARSLGEAVTWWTEALESGAWVFDHGRGVWAGDLDWNGDVKRAATGLV
jgi:cell wall assembly regulator SMI1